MALATQCPHCHTTFRVAHDQLKLRAGVVRCGQCQQVFNGIEHLLPAAVLQAENSGIAPEAVPPAAQAQVAVATTPAEPANGAVKPDALEDFDALHYRASERMPLSTAPQEQPPLPEQPCVAASDTAIAALADQHTELPTTSGASTEEDVRDQDNQRQAAATQFAQDAEEPGFVTAARRQPQQRRRNRRLFGTGCAILALVLLAQAAYGWRNTLAAYLPQARPALLTMCRTFDCSIALPARIDAISIESSELQAQPGSAGALTLAVLLRNRSNTAQAWPNLELSLNDGTERVIVRRVFAPREFPLSAADITQGLAANSEKPVRLSFMLNQLQAAGYRVVAFYP